jgi:hypothetical protein
VKRSGAVSGDRKVAAKSPTLPDLDVLGTGLERLFGVKDDDIFADLLAQLDQAVAPSGANAPSRKIPRST